MYRVGICGHFGFGKNLSNGQTVKTENIASELEKTFGQNEVLKMDSSGGKKQIFRNFKDAFKLIKECKNVVMLPAHNGVLIFTPLFRFLNVFFKRKLHYVVIGGWLQDYLKSHKFIWKLLKKYDKIYVETDHMKNQLEKMDFHNVVVMPNFKYLKMVDISEKPRFEESYRFCTFSRVMYEKGIEHAIEAVKIINNKYEREVCTLDIFGPVDKGYQERFDNVIANMPPYINYLGKVESHKSTDVLKDYHALLFPTLFTQVEGFPGTILDSYASATPVVAFNWKNNLGIIKHGENGVICDGTDVDALADGINLLISNKALYEKMRDSCLDFAKDYLPEKIMPILTNEL